MIVQVCNEIKTKVSEFEHVNGTHIPVRRPYIHSWDYFNFKQYFLLNVQAVCGLWGIFRDVGFRWSGCVHDTKVFANSNVHNKVKSGHLPPTFNNLLPGYDKMPNYLIGDPAYPLTPCSIKEYQSCKTNSKVFFKSMLQEAHNPV